jgi:hypothetical protein
MIKTGMTMRIVRFSHMLASVEKILARLTRFCVIRFSRIYMSSTVK